jgi:DNA invertase Pin-like site-specific DNA recombinase
MRDRDAKGRSGSHLRSGERHGNAKLTEPQVREIRRLHAEDVLRVHEIARKFGVHESTVRHIACGGAWRSILDDQYVYRRRRTRGERHWTAKLTARQVEEIRAAGARGESHRSIARRYPVGKSAIGSILKGLTYQ